MMNQIVSYGFFCIGIVELFWGKNIDLAAKWFMISALYSIAGGVWYGCNRRNKEIL